MKKYRLGYKFNKYKNYGIIYLYNDTNMINLISHLDRESYVALRKLCKYENKYMRKCKRLSITHNIDFANIIPNTATADMIAIYIGEGTRINQERLNENRRRNLVFFTSSDNSDGGVFLVVNSTSKERKLFCDKLVDKKDVVTIFHINKHFKKTIGVFNKHHAAIFLAIMNAYRDMDKLNYMENRLISTQ